VYGIAIAATTPFSAFFPTDLQLPGSYAAKDRQSTARPHELSMKVVNLEERAEGAGWPQEDTQSQRDNSPNRRAIWMTLPPSKQR
jgi:hypothetical protein